LYLLKNQRPLAKAPKRNPLTRLAEFTLSGAEGLATLSPAERGKLLSLLFSSISGRCFQQGTL
ncbi:MAG: hypothetical protein ACRD18_11095, partial [Terriglobia bacterium]